jgi:ubiquinone/menaquinone biosynthesis C-methylase UbiE
MSYESHAVSRDVDAFNRDVDENGGYRYTTNTGIAARHVHAKMDRELWQMANLAGKRVVDIGCGDGTHTRTLYETCKTAYVMGVDPADRAVEMAKALNAGRLIDYAVGTAEHLEMESNSFDVAVLRAVIHHTESPVQALREALRVAPKVIVSEPNGNNPIVKWLERNSKYHIDHNERSYTSNQFKAWAGEIGAVTTAESWKIFVPMMGGNLIHAICRPIEMALETNRLTSKWLCSTYFFALSRA